MKFSSISFDIDIKNKKQNKKHVSPLLKSHFKFEITDMVVADCLFKMFFVAMTQNEILGWLLNSLLTLLRGIVLFTLY